jgi:hypothetical protein
MNWVAKIAKREHTLQYNSFKCEPYKGTTVKKEKPLRNK